MGLVPKYYLLAGDISQVFISSLRQIIAQVYSLPGQIEGKTKAFLEWTSVDLSYKRSLTCGGNVNCYKSVCHPISTLGNIENPGNFQNKSVNSPFS